MPSIHRTAIVPHSAAQLYALVADVDAYTEFLPWCQDSRVLERAGDEATALIHIHYGSLNRSFTTRNRMQADRCIEMQLVEGPFRQLHGVWQFLPLEDQACKISFSLDYEFSSRLVALVAGPAFGKIADGLVEAFCRRADVMYRR